MNQQDAKWMLELVPILKAYTEGETIQYKGKGDNKWRDAPNPIFTNDPSYYRIKTEPVERWINVYPHMTDYSYAIEKNALRSLSDGGRTIHMKEVLD